MRAKPEDVIRWARVGLTTEQMRQIIHFRLVHDVLGPEAPVLRQHYAAFGIPTRPLPNGDFSLSGVGE